jgi:hypothetical protein
MNRNQTKILVESWRDYMGVLPGYNAAMSNFKTKSEKSSVESSQEFFNLVVDYKNSSKEWDPNDQGAGNNQEIRSNEIYRALWESFWGTFNSSAHMRRLKKYRDKCVWRFFDHLGKVRQSSESKEIFDTAFSILMFSKDSSAGPGLAGVIIEILFNDYMHNMKGGVEGYCWETDEEGRKLYTEFSDNLPSFRKQVLFNMNANN